MGEAEKRGDEPNIFAQLIDEAEGLDRIEHLQNHANESIYQKAISILETYFDVEEKDVENLQPTVDPNAGLYAFGAAPQQQNQGGAFNFGPGAMA